MAKQVMVMTGRKELDRAMNSLPIENKVRKRIIAQAARGAVKRRLLEQIRVTTPKKTGFLRKNIKVIAIKSTRTYIGARVSAGLPGKASDNVGKAYYGAFLLWGTGIRFHKETGKAVGKITANPWIYDMTNRRRNITLKDYSRRIKDNIIKAAKGEKI
jgi:hypothetical protein